MTPAEADSRCVVKDCRNRTGQGTFRGAFCYPCYGWVTERRGDCRTSQAARNEVATPSVERERLLTLLRQARQVLADNSMEFAWLEAALEPPRRTCGCLDGVRGPTCEDYHALP